MNFSVLPSMNLRKIINVTSLYGNLQTGEPHYLQYSAFKAALANLSATLNKVERAQGHRQRHRARLHRDASLDRRAAGSYRGLRALHRSAASSGRVNLRPRPALIAENDALVGQVVTLDGGTSLIACPTLPPSPRIAASSPSTVSGNIRPPKIWRIKADRAGHVPILFRHRVERPERRTDRSRPRAASRPGRAPRFMCSTEPPGATIS